MSAQRKKRNQEVFPTLKMKVWDGRYRARIPLVNPTGIDRELLLPTHFASFNVSRLNRAISLSFAVSTAELMDWNITGEYSDNITKGGVGRDTGQKYFMISEDGYEFLYSYQIGIRIPLGKDNPYIIDPEARAAQAMMVRCGSNEFTPRKYKDRYQRLVERGFLEKTDNGGFRAIAPMPLTLK